MAIEGTQIDTLDRWLTQRGITQLSPRDTVHFIRQAALELQLGHDRHMLYLHVRPQSFIVHSAQTQTSLPDIQLLDISTIETVAMKEIFMPAQATALYIAPEQWDGQPCAATDQYALCMVAYQFLAGRTPFSGPKERVIQQHRLIPPPPPSTINKYLSPAIDAVVLHALEKQPEQRFASVTQFVRALEQAIAYSDLRATLTISRGEARNGTQRTITLPGKRQVTVTVPAGTREQQVLRLEGQGEALYEQGPRGPLFLTISIKEDEPSLPTKQSQVAEQAPSELSQPSHTASSNSPNSFFAVQPVQNMLATPSTTHLPDTFPSAYTPPLYTPPSIPISTPAFSHATQSPLKHTRLIIVTIAILLILSSGILFALYQYVHSPQVPTASTFPIAQASAGTTPAIPTQSVANTNAVNATATTTIAHANPNPYGKILNTLRLLDPLSNNQSGAKWEVAANGDSFCTFSNGAYHISTAKNNYSFFCTADAQPYAQLRNFVYEVQMTILKGDAGGMGFRLSAPANLDAYYMRLTQDGYYALILFGATNKILVSGTSTAIHTGLNKTNTLAVAVIGDHIDFYINSTHIDSVTDSTYVQGQIALVASDLTNATEIAFHNMRLWA